MRTKSCMSPVAMLGLVLVLGLVAARAPVPALKAVSTTEDPTTTSEPTGPPPTCTSYPCLVFSDEFKTLDFDKWEHEITAGGGGNWEFQYYLNNRSNSYVKDGHLFIKPTLTSDRYGEAFLTSGTLDLWGSSPSNLCTGPSFYGCQRVGTPDNLINPVQSARLRSNKGFSFKYGKIEARARLPKGDWLWPVPGEIKLHFTNRGDVLIAGQMLHNQDGNSTGASLKSEENTYNPLAIWMVPLKEEYGTWPASGEFDIVESRGNSQLFDEKGNAMGNTHAGATLHWGPYWPLDAYQKTTQFKDGDFGDNMHTFGMEWNETDIRLFYDGEEILKVDPGTGGFWKYGEFDKMLPNPESNPWRGSLNKLAPFDKDFYIIMNVAVGGTNGFFPDTWTNRPYPKPWRNDGGSAFRDFWNAKNQWYPTWDGENAAMEVDYIRVWKLKPDN